MKIYPQELINIDVTAKPNLNSIPEVVEVIEAAEAELGNQGRVLVRYSGTQNMCRVMVEGPEVALTSRLAESIADAVRAAIGAPENL
jgi:phosphoglucosamine mutase